MSLLDVSKRLFADNGNDGDNDSFSALEVGAEDSDNTARMNDATVISIEDLPQPIQDFLLEDDEDNGPAYDPDNDILVVYDLNDKIEVNPDDGTIIIPNDIDLSDIGVLQSNERLETGDRVSILNANHNPKVIGLTKNSVPDFEAVEAAAEAADEAAKKATNYIGFDPNKPEEGITIGAVSPDINIDRSVNINAGGVDILDKESIIAHYGSYSLIGTESVGGVRIVGAEIPNPNNWDGTSSNPYFIVSDYLHKIGTNKFGVGVYEGCCPDYYFDENIYPDNHVNGELIRMLLIDRTGELLKYPCVIDIQTNDPNNYGLPIYSHISSLYNNQTDVIGGIAFEVTTDSDKIPISFDWVPSHGMRVGDLYTSYYMDYANAHVDVQGSISFLGDKAYIGIVPNTSWFGLYGDKGSIFSSKQSYLLGDSYGINILDYRPLIWDSINQEWIIDPQRADDEIFTIRFIADDVKINNSSVLSDAALISFSSGTTDPKSYQANTQYRIKFDESSNTSLATVNSGVVTVNESGTYLITCDCIMKPGSAANTTFTERLYKNFQASGTSGYSGTQVDAMSCYAYSANWSGMHMSTILNLSAGDTIGMTNASNVTNTNTTTVAAHTKMCVVRIN